jgi:hypothetical protein
MSTNTKETAGVAFGWMLGRFPHGRRRKHVYRTLPTRLEQPLLPQTPQQRRATMGNTAERPGSPSCHAVMHVEQGPDAIIKALKKQSETAQWRSLATTGRLFGIELGEIHGTEVCQGLGACNGGTKTCPDTPSEAGLI